MVPVARLAELALDGEAVLNLVGDFGVGLQLRERGRLSGDGDAIGDGHAAGWRAAYAGSSEEDRAAAGVAVAGKIEQWAAAEAVVVDAAAAANDGLASSDRGPRRRRRAAKSRDGAWQESSASRSEGRA